MPARGESGLGEMISQEDARGHHLHCVPSQSKRKALWAVVRQPVREEEAERGSSWQGTYTGSAFRLHGSRMVLLHGV